jgi:hypothetical protein
MIILLTKPLLIPNTNPWILPRRSARNPKNSDLGSGLLSPGDKRLHLSGKHQSPQFYHILSSALLIVVCLLIMLAYVTLGEGNVS